MTAARLDALVATIRARIAAGGEGSYTAALARRGTAHAARKLGEEAVEAVVAAVSGDRDALRSEAADVIFHLVALLEIAGVPFESVLDELDRRTGRSGLEEKAARGTAAGTATSGDTAAPGGIADG